MELKKQMKSKKAFSVAESSQLDDSEFMESIKESELDNFLKVEFADEMKQINEESSDDESLGFQEASQCDCEATVLIVDDNPFNLIPLEVMLGNIGIVCGQAHGG